MKVVTGVVGNDIHVVANRLIDLSLQARGFEVFNLGVNTYLEEFFDNMRITSKHYTTGLQDLKYRAMDIHGVPQNTITPYVDYTYKNNTYRLNKIESSHTNFSSERLVMDLVLPEKEVDINNLYGNTFEVLFDKTFNRSANVPCEKDFRSPPAIRKKPLFL